MPEGTLGLDPTPVEIAELIHNWQAGRRDALDHLMPLVYDRLRMLANHHLKGEAPGHSLRATELVHEAYLKLLDRTRRLPTGCISMRWHRGSCAICW